jgi:hypothetical protein
LLQAKDRLNDADFDDDELCYRLIWKVARDYYDKYKNLISCAQLYADLEKLMCGMLECSDPQVKQAIYNKAYQCFSTKEILPEHALGLLQDFLQERQVRTPLIEAVESGNTRDTTKLLGDLNTRHRNTQITLAEPLQPFKKGSEFFGVPQRTETGIIFLDRMLGGGTRCGESYGFLAPSGGGKTTLLNQIGTEVARRGHPFVIFHYEQQLRGKADNPRNEFWVGPYAYALGLTKKRIEEIHSLTDLHDDEREVYETVSKELGDYLYFFDFSGSLNTAGSGGTEEIDAYLTDFKSKGIQIAGFGVDWFWLLMMRSLSLNTDERENAERRYAQSLVKKLKELADKHNCWVWINHQLAAAKGTNCRQPVKWTDAAEFKSFAWTLDCCFGLSGLDENGVALLEMSKGRNLQVCKTSVKLDGAGARFSPQDDDYVWDKRVKKYVPKDKKNKPLVGSTESVSVSNEQRDYEAVGKTPPQDF